MARLLYLTQGYTLHDHRFLAKLADSPHEVWFLPCESPHFHYETRELPHGVHGLPSLSDSDSEWGPIQWLPSLIRLRKHLREIRPQLIHAGPVQKGGFLAALVGFHPLLVMSWGSDVLTEADKNRWARWITRFTLTKADMAMGDSTTVRNKILSLSHLKSDQIVLFPWGVDLQEFRPRPSPLRLRFKRGWGEDPLLVATRGFEPIHDPMTLIEAFRQARQALPHVRLVWVGTGRLKGQIEAYIDEHGLRESVDVVGQVPNHELPDYFNEADFYVSSTLSDGSSISMLEAMACARPVIVTEGYGNLDWVKPEENGWLYPARNAAALAAAIQQAVKTTRDQRDQMGRVNRALVTAKANWDENFKLLLSAYDRLLKGGDRDAV